ATLSRPSTQLARMNSSNHPRPISTLPSPDHALTVRFLVRPTLDRMKSHKSYSIVYALLANAGQFQQEAEQRAALSGVSATRAALCELLATKLLKEFSPRQLVCVTSICFWLTG